MPTNRLDRFTQRARQVLNLAETTAQDMKHAYIGTQHLLLAFMQEGGGVAARVLGDLGLELEKVETLVRQYTTGTPIAIDMLLELSPGTKRTLELAVDEARRMGHHYLGTEHLLLGLVRHNEGAATEILNAYGATPELVRRQLRKVLQEPPSAATRIPPPVEEPSPPARISEAKKRVLQFSVTDKNTGTVKFDWTLSVSRAQMMVDAIYKMLDGDEVNGIGFDDDDSGEQIVILIRDEEPKPESGSADANE